jgi:hypothetical protein
LVRVFAGNGFDREARFLSFDQALIGRLTAALMDQLEAHYDPEARIGAACLIVEVESPERGSQVVTIFSDEREHVALGLLEVARRAVGGAS